MKSVKIMCCLLVGALAAGMPRLAIAVSDDMADVSAQPLSLLRLKESVRSNLWATSLCAELGLPEIDWQGVHVHLTVDPYVQVEAENAIELGLQEFDAASGCAIVMNAKTGAIYAMASYPAHSGTNCAITCTLNYEPGAVLMVMTAAAALDSNPHQYYPDARFNTDREDPDFYRLPGDGCHKWEPTMSLKDAICRSSNIVIGKVAYALGPYILHRYLKQFGFGAKTGIELPREQVGILPDPSGWDKASWSRAGIGQYIVVSPIQIASAYQAIANDGIRMRPYLIDKIAGKGDVGIVKREPKAAGRAISADTARKLRQMMTGVVSEKGTAPCAAIPGYSVVGKTGTAQKPDARGWGWSFSEFYATFCGIVQTELVILTVLEFSHPAEFHQGGNAAAPVFRRIALAAIARLGILPDKPDEL